MKIQKQISHRWNPFSDFAFDGKFEIWILKSKSRFPNRMHPLSTILEKSHWDSTSITEVWCESQCSEKQYYPLKNHQLLPNLDPIQISDFIFCFAPFQKVSKTNTIHYKSKRKQNQKLHQLSKVKRVQWPKELRLSSWSLPHATYWHRHLSNSPVTPPSLCKSSIQCWSIKEIAISELPQASVSKQG